VPIRTFQSQLAERGFEILFIFVFVCDFPQQTVVPETEDWQLKKDNSICQREDTAKAMDLLAKKLLSGKYTLNLHLVINIMIILF